MFEIRLPRGRDIQYVGSWLRAFDHHDVADDVEVGRDRGHTLVAWRDGQVMAYLEGTFEQVSDEPWATGLPRGLHAWITTLVVGRSARAEQAAQRMVEHFAWQADRGYCSWLGVRLDDDERAEDLARVLAATGFGAVSDQPVVMATRLWDRVSTTGVELPPASLGIAV